MKKLLCLTALIFTCSGLGWLIAADAQIVQPTAEEYVRRAIESNLKRDFDGAIANYDKAVELEPDKTDFYFSRGSVHSTKCASEKSARDCELGICDFTKVIELDPDYPGLKDGPYFERGYIYFLLENYDAAIRDVTKEIELRPDAYALLMFRGDVYRAKGSFEEAIEDYARVIAIEPNAPGIFYHRAEAYHLKGDYARAVQDFGEAIRRDPEESLYYAERAIVYRKMGKESLARADERKAARLKKKAGF